MFFQEKPFILDHLASISLFFSSFSEAWKTELVFEKVAKERKREEWKSKTERREVPLGWDKLSERQMCTEEVSSAKKLPGKIIRSGLAHSPGVPTVNICDIFFTTRYSPYWYITKTDRPLSSSRKHLQSLLKTLAGVSFPEQTLCISGSGRAPFVLHREENNVGLGKERKDSWIDALTGWLQSYLHKK